MNLFRQAHAQSKRSQSSHCFVVFSLLLQSKLNMDMCIAPEKQNPHHFRKYHTPFCEDACVIKHHDLVAALCVNWRYVKNHQPGILPPVLTEAIESTRLLGWDKDSVVPDPLEQLRCPLLYLACAFGKNGILEGLLRQDFDPRVVNQHGETALHGAARHLFNTGTSSRKETIGKNVSTKKGREEVFFSIVSLLTKYYPRLLAFKDNSGFTAFHLCATKITYTNSNKSVSFHQFCLKVMIKRLFELEAASLLSKYEVIEIIKTPDNEHGDSILHILARDRKDGFEVLKFVRHFVLLGIGTELPNEKNRRNETVFSIACQTNALGAEEIFPGLCGDSCQHFDWRYQDPSTTAQLDRLRGTGFQVANIDTTMPQVYHNFINTSFLTGHPFAELNATPSNPNFDHALPRVLVGMPKITNTFSLAGEAACPERSQESSKTECVENSSTSSGNVEVMEKCWRAYNRSDWIEPHTDEVSQSACSENAETCSTTSSEIEIVESSDEPSDLSQSPSHGDEARNTERESSFLEFVLTEGISLDAFSKRDIVALVLTKHTEKIRELEESIPQLEDTLKQSETSIAQKTARLNSLQKEVDSLRKEITEEKNSRNELRQKIELMNDEKSSLKRRVEHCQETKDLLTIPTKKARV